MFVRLFLTNWLLINSSITTPIAQHIEYQEENGLSLPYFEFVQNYYPSATAQGTPNKTLVLVMIRGDIGIEDFDNIQNVYMIPPEMYSQPVTNPIKNRFRQISDAFGIPSNLIDDAATNGEAIDRVMRYLEPASSGLGQFGIEHDAEFQ